MKTSKNNKDMPKFLTGIQNTYLGQKGYTILKSDITNTFFNSKYYI